jgi:hypothetical protein
MAAMIGVDEFVERLCMLGARPGPRRFPRGQRDREILLKSVRMLLDPVAEYSEKQFGAVLQRWRDNVAPEIEIDCVTLRRLLVDYGEVERTRDGAVYRLGFPGRPVAFDLEIDELDLEATVAAYRQGREHRARARRALSR